jgi:excinuclease ABC subunit A
VSIAIRGARQHNLKDVSLEIGPGLTVVTGVSGSGKTSLVFDTLYHEARRRFLDIYSLGSAAARLAPANVDAITGLGPAVAVGQNLLNRNPNSTLASASGLHPFLRLLYAHFGERTCPACGARLFVYSEDELVERLAGLLQQGPGRLSVPLLTGVPGSHRTLLAHLASQFAPAAILVDGAAWGGLPLEPSQPHDLELLLSEAGEPPSPHELRRLVQDAAALGSQAVRVVGGDFTQVLGRSPVCVGCGTWFGELRPVHFNAACPHCAGKGCAACQGSGLHPQAAGVRLGMLRFHEFLALSVDEAGEAFALCGLPAQAARLKDEIERRLAALQKVGLGYIGLDRPSPTLARGEAQRVRLALTLISRLEDMLHILDEPTIGQHPADVQRLLPAFGDLPGPVVFVEHDRLAAAGADQAVDLGPGAGWQGGEVVFQGTPYELWKADTATGEYFSLRKRLELDPHPGLTSQRAALFAPPLYSAAPPKGEGKESESFESGSPTPDPNPGSTSQGAALFAPPLYSAAPPKGEGRGSDSLESEHPHARDAAPDKFLTIRAASLRNLRDINAPIPLQRLTVITGVSGSGKSTLVEDVLVASLANGVPTGCQGIDGPPLKPVMVDQSPIGRNPRSNPATYTKLADLIRDLFAAAGGFSPSHFSFNRPEGACPTCHGLGAVEIAMRYLPPTWVPCADCDGERFTDEVLAVRVPFAGQRLSVAAFFELTVSQALAFFSGESSLPAPDRLAALRILQALQDIGLGYLTLGQPSPTLSGGEAQRVKLARYLGGKSLASQLLVLDEPSTGLHPQDLAGLLAVLERLVRAGATIVMVEHNTDLIRSADWTIDLGPGAGPQGGRLLYAGPPQGLLSVPDSQTGQALLAEADILPPTVPPSRAYTGSAQIEVRGARMHNLQQVNIGFPKGALTVVTGLSGSGKSSLVHDVLEAEARRRFLETLSLYERQGAHEGPEAEVDSISGLGVALTVAPERLVYSRRATVGSATEISHHLSVLFSLLGERSCQDCAGPMRRTTDGWLCPSCGSSAPLARPHHFISSTYAAACLKCNGVGSMQTPQPKKLIIHPEKPLTNGAMYSPGFFPNGYLGKPFNGGYYLVQALARRYGFDPAATPWNEMAPEARQAFLFGTTELLDVTAQSRSGRTSRYQAPFPGFYGFIRDWDVGGTYTDNTPCPECQGARLRKEYLAVTLLGHNIYQLSQMSLAQLGETLGRLPLPEGERLPARGSLTRITERLHFLTQVGLGYLHLDRVAGTLSAGEVQRVRLASLLGSGLTSLTLLVDEPTRGLHPSEVDALIQALLKLRQEGNTVILVEHDLQVIRSADYLVDMGPEAGRLGGQVVAQGTPAQVAASASITAGWLRGEAQIRLRKTPRQPRGWMKIIGARANNLQGETVSLPLGVLAGVCGVSGSGKSTLVIDTLGRVLVPKKQTTSVAYAPVEPGEHERIEGAPPRALLVDQSRAGVSSPAAFLNLTPALRSIFALSPDAKALGLSEEQLAGRCSVCGGSGVISLDMAFLPDVRLPCETCRGTGCLPEAWEVRLKGCSLPEVFGLSIDQVYELFGEDERLSRPLSAARRVGLAYLVLRQPGYALSGGEAQRLKLALEFSRKGSPSPRQLRWRPLSQEEMGKSFTRLQPGHPSPLSQRERGGGEGESSLYILDEPSVGQHLEDVQRLVGVLQELVDGGGSVLVVEHHPHLLAACDWLVELGPGGGPDGGRVIASGTPAGLAGGNTPIAPYLRQVLEGGA